MASASRSRSSGLSSSAALPMGGGASLPKKRGNNCSKVGTILRLLDQRRAQGHAEALPVLHAQRLDRAKGVGALGNRDAHPGRAQAGDEVDDALFHGGSW